MKNIILISLFATGFMFGSTYSTTQASKHIGKSGKVCGIVSGGYYAQSSKGKPTFINLDGVYPHNAFTVVIWGYNRHKFRTAEREYKDKRLCVTGKISAYKGVPQIVVDHRKQLQ